MEILRFKPSQVEEKDGTVYITVPPGNIIINSKILSLVSSNEITFQLDKDGTVLNALNQFKFEVWGREKRPVSKVFKFSILSMQTMTNGELHNELAYVAIKNQKIVSYDLVKNLKNKALNY